MNDPVAVSRTPTTPLGISPEEKRHIQETVAGFADELKALGVSQRQVTESQRDSREQFFSVRMIPLENRMQWVAGIATASMVIAVLCVIALMLVLSKR